MQERLQAYIEEQLQRKEYRPVTVAIIFNTNKEVLLVKSAYEDSGTPWMFPQGGIEAGESVEDATDRELAEELPGIEVGIQGISYGIHNGEVNANASRTNRRGFSKGKAYIYSALNYFGDNSFGINTSELSKTQWVSVDKARELLQLGRSEKAALSLEALDKASSLL